MGIGGNIAVSSGPDGVFIVDDDMPPMAGEIDKAIRSIQNEPVKMVFNTHWHFDHTGGNLHFGKQGAQIIAHDNVRARMSTPQKSSFFDSITPPSPAEALPVVTFDNTLTLHINGSTIRAVHIPGGHTDGDGVIFFEEANIVHTGDIFTNRQYPFIDISGGGSARGMIAAVDSLLPMLNEETVIIPGHGPVGDIEDLKAFRNMMFTVVSRIQLLIDDGKTADEVLALKPSINYDAEWAWDFLPAETWDRLIYDSLVADGTPAEAD
jgi:glyoxylase-like metal-dependent hydrolase (beta-lactamase superfamily II)